MLPFSAIKAIRTTVESKYAKHGSEPLWERLCEVESVHNPSAWRLLDFFVGGEAAIVFFNHDEDQTALKLEAQASVSSLLSECTGFEFYLTDESTSYLLCFNHHDCLIGCGRARQWMITLQSPE